MAFQELLVLSFFARPKNETKKGALCKGVFLATGPKNRPSAPKFFPGFQKFFTVPMGYTYTRDKDFASLGPVKISKYSKEKKTVLPSLATNNSQLKTPNQQSASAKASAGRPTTDNSQPITHNRQPTTHNSEPTTDSNKQQTKNHKHLRVIQMVDTLNPGGAERMAVNLANSLVGEVEASYLCCTREEGMLKEELEEEVGYLYLDKKHSLDLQAFWKLRTFVKNKKIDLVHAHGTSWFWGVLLKISGLKIKLVWHDHYGESEQLEQRDVKVLKLLSRYFDGIISVNKDLKAWAEKELKAREVTQLNNFIVPSEKKGSRLKLKGGATDFKIVCVANIRPQKDHLNLLAAFEKLQGEEISLHLIGADPGIAWSKKILEKVADMKKVYYYGGLPEVSGLLRQADLGILSSRSEGLPLVLLEYGMAGLPVVATEVGQCREVTGDAAILVPPGDAQALAEAIKKYYFDPERRKKDALALHNRIEKAYSREAVLPLFLKFYANLSGK